MTCLAGKPIKGFALARFREPNVFQRLFLETQLTIKVPAKPTDSDIRLTAYIPVRRFGVEAVQRQKDNAESKNTCRFWRRGFRGLYGSFNRHFEQALACIFQRRAARTGGILGALLATLTACGGVAKRSLRTMI